MPLAKSKSKPRRYRKRPQYRRRRMMRRRGANGVSEWASASFTRTLFNPQPPPGGLGNIFLPNVTYRFYDCAIDQFPRAIPIASAYQQYRIKRITLKIRPLVDTFTAGAAETVPQFYYQIDKIRALSPNVGLPSMKTMGCVPRRLDDSNLTVSWAPGVLDPASDNAAGNLTFSKTNISPWLNTSDDPFNPPVAVSSVDHLGCIWHTEQLVGVSGNYTVECTIDVQFRKPAFEPTEQAVVAVNVA